MKKRILALLLAGLLTASLASCFNNSANDGNGTDGGTEPDQTTPSVEDTTTPPAPITFKDVDETVYTVVDKAKLLVDLDVLNSRQRIGIYCAVFTKPQYSGLINCP